MGSLGPGPAPRLEVLLNESLDAALQQELRGKVRRIVKEPGITSAHVTNDLEEAPAIVNRLGVMRAGRLMEVGGAPLPAAGSFEAGERAILFFRSEDVRDGEGSRRVVVRGSKFQGATCKVTAEFAGRPLLLYSDHRPTPGDELAFEFIRLPPLLEADDLS